MLSRSRIRSGVNSLKEDIAVMEKKLSARRSKSPSRPVSHASAQNKLPWNHGGGCSKKNPTATNRISRRETSPRRTRSRSRNLSLGREKSPDSKVFHRIKSPEVQILHCRNSAKSPSKTVVHKQTINPGDKQTIVEVSVKTKHQGKRTTAPFSSIPVGSKGHLLHELAGLDISSLDPKNCGTGHVNSEVPISVKKEQSWSNVLKQSDSHPTVTDGTHLTRRRSKFVAGANLGSEPLSVKAAVFPHQMFPPPDFHTCSRGEFRESATSRENGPACGDGNIPTDSVETLTCLMKELRRNVQQGDSQQVQRIFSIMESLLASLPAKENLEPPTSLGLEQAPNSRQRYRLSVKRPAHDSCSSSPVRVSPTQVFLPDSDILRLSPTPGSPEQRDQMDVTAQKTYVSDFIAHFRNTLREVSAGSSPPEGKHKSRKTREKVLKEQLDELVRHVEESSSKLQTDCETLRKEKNSLQMELEERNNDLLKAHASVQKYSAECEELRADIQRANLELKQLRDDLTNVTQISSSHEKKSQELQKLLDKLAEENKNLQVYINMSRLEKEKLALMLSRKSMELSKCKEEIKDLHAKMAEQLANVHSLADRNRTLTQLDAMMRSLSQQSLLSDTTIEEKILGGSEIPNSRPEIANRIHSSPTSSASTSEFFTSWHKLSTITSEDESPKRKGKSKELRNQRRKDKIVNKGKVRSSGLGDIFSELKNKSSASAMVSLPSPPRDNGFSFSGMSQWTEVSTNGSITISDDSHSDTGSTV